MNPDFIQIKSLEGDLKMSHKKQNYGLTVSTKELILHKPHMNYIFRLDDIVSIVPFDNAGWKPVTFENSRAANLEAMHVSPGSKRYKLYVKAATLHNRSGIFKLGALDVIIPIHDTMLKAISECASQHGLSAI